MKLTKERLSRFGNDEEYILTEEEIQQILKNQKIIEKIKTKDISLWKETFETIEKIQFKKELTPWDEVNITYLEELVKFIIEESEK